MDIVMTRVLSVELEALVERIVTALQKEATNHTATGATPTIELAALQFTKVVDPGNQLPGYEGIWRNSRNDRCGTLTINSDNSFYAEYDLFCPHPRDPRWFVEMVTAWGNETSLHNKTTLIPSL